MSRAGQWDVSSVVPRALTAAIAAIAALALPTRVEAAFGDLLQKPVPAGCFTGFPFHPACSFVTGMAEPRGVAVSPDGASVYVVSGIGQGAVTVFDRATDGTVIRKPGTAGCITESGSGGLCSVGRALRAPSSVTVSPDGTSVYVTANMSHAVAVFDRAADGTLTQQPLASINLVGARWAAVSPDGASVYVVSGLHNAIYIFDRAADGTLTRKAGAAGCIADDVLGGPPPGCGVATWLRSPLSVAVSPDGITVYVAAFDGDAVVVFNRAIDGTLSQKTGAAGCFANHAGSPERPCTDGRALDGPLSVVVAPDGRSILVASDESNALVTVTRDTTGTLSLASGPAGCVSQPAVEGCASSPDGLDGAAAVAVSPDGKSVYVGAFATFSVFDRHPATIRPLRHRPRR